MKLIKLVAGVKSNSRVVALIEFMFNAWFKSKSPNQSLSPPPRVLTNGPTALTLLQVLNTIPDWNGNVPELLENVP